MVLSIAFLRECLAYDPDTGTFTWRVRPRSHFKEDRVHKGWNRRCAGKSAGVPSTSDRSIYWRIRVNNRLYHAHRLAWMLTYDSNPAPLEVDHINGNSLDNRIVNLRIATRSENARNSGARINSQTGIKGVSPHKNGYIAQITLKRRHRYLGLFRTLEEAVEARRKAAIALHGEFVRHE